MTQKLPFKVTLRVLRKLPFITFLTILATTLIAVAQGVMPYVFIKITHYAVEKNSHLMNKWIIITTIICVIWVASIVLTNIMTEKFKNRIITILRTDYCKNIYRENTNEFAKGGKGIHWDNLTNSLSQIATQYFGGYRMIIWSTVTVVTVFVSIVLLNVYIAICLAVICIIAKAILIIFDKKLKNKTNSKADVRKAYNTELDDLTQGYETLFWNDKSDALERRINNSSLNIQKANISYFKTHKKFEFVNELISILVSTGIMLVLGIFVFKVDKSIAAIFIGVLIAETSFQTAINKFINNSILIRQTKPLRENSDYIFVENKTQQDNVVFNDSINIKGLKFNYDDKEIIDGLNFKISKGEKIAILGKSGSGKSTLLKLLLKQLKPQEGVIEFDQKNIESLNEEVFLNNIGYANNHNLIVDDTFENNMFLFGGDKIKFKELKTMFNLNFIKSKTSKITKEELSTGQQQRVNLARLWVNKKPIVILDECLGNLDKENSNLILNNIIEDKETTLIMISHHLTPKQTKLFDKVIKL